MLRKLIKYEWKGHRMMGLILIGVVAFATLFGFLASRSPIWSDVRIYDNVIADLTNMMSIFSFLLYFLLLSGVVYAILIYVAVRFYRTMYTDEGYLLHTLPVTKNQILISKILTGTIWVLITYVAMFVSVVLFILFMMEAIEPGSVGVLMSNLPQFFHAIGIALRDMDHSARMTLIHFLVSGCLSILLGIPSALITIFGAISLGQLFSKHRVLMAILCYVGIMIVTSIITSVVRTLSYTSSILFSTEEMFGYIFSYIDLTLVVHLLMAVGFYSLSYFITSRKLNME